MGAPLAQLVVLGNAFGGNVKNVQIAVVDQDRGPEVATVQARLQAVAANVRTFIPVEYPEQGQAVQDLRERRVAAVLIIPENYSRDLLARRRPRLALVTDNSDNFVSSTVAATMRQLVGAIDEPAVHPRMAGRVSLDQVDLYPFISYIKYLLPGSITLGIFATAMIGGGIIFLDDKARGVHEGYLVTPITKLELIVGFNTAGLIKAAISGTVVLILGCLIAGVPGLFDPVRLLNLMVLIVVTSASLIGMMFFLMARVSDPLVPRAVFGVLNMLLFFPSGAIYPIAAFPPWMQWIATIDPFAYGVHGFRTLLLTQAGMAGVYEDIVVLSLLSVLMLGGATLLFKRTL